MASIFRVFHFFTAIVVLVHVVFVVFETASEGGGGENIVNQHRHMHTGKTSAAHG